MRVSINGFPQAEHGGRRLSTNLYLGGSDGSVIGRIKPPSCNNRESVKGTVREIYSHINRIYGTPMLVDRLEQQKTSDVNTAIGSATRRMQVRQ